MAYLLKKRRSALPSPEKKRRMTMATCLSSGLGNLQYQDPPLTCRSEESEKSWAKLLDGHLLPLLSREMWRWSWHIFRE